MKNTIKAFRMLLAISFALLILVGCSNNSTSEPTNSISNSELSNDSYHYSEKLDGYIYYGENNKNLEEVTINETYNGKPVVALSGAFYNCDNLKRVNLPNTIKYIYSDTFNGCVNLETINIPSSLVEVGQCAFKNCKALKQIFFQEGLEKVGLRAFEGCESLEYVSFPNSIKSFEFSVFDDCPNMHYNVSDGANYLGNDNNTYVILYSISSEINELTIREGCIIVGARACINQEKLKKVSFSSTLKYIEDDSFYGNYLSGELVFPNSLEFIGSNAFNAYHGINNGDSTPTSYESNSTNEIIALHFGDEIKEIMQNAFEFNQNIEKITYTKTVDDWGYVEKEFQTYKMKTDLIECSDFEYYVNFTHFLGEGDYCQNHSFTEWNLDFEKEGFSRVETRICEKCKFTEVRKVEHTHSFYEYENDEEKHWMVCECGEKFQEERHTFRLTRTIDPLCEREGESDFVCTVCNKTKTIKLSALGHDMVHYDAVEATCTEIGWEAFDACTRCDYMTYQELKPLGHNPGDVIIIDVINPTCTKDGSHIEVIKCTRCNIVLDRRNVVDNALGHDLLHHDAKAPECLEIGWEAYDTCTRCDYNTYKEIGYLFHNTSDVFIENVINPTCTNNGSYDEVIYCTRCEAEIERNTIKEYAFGHNLVHHDAKGPTCTEIGWEKYDTCTRCDYTTYQEIEFLGHIPNNVIIENVIKPTCINEGSYDEVIYCMRCGDELERNTINDSALGHELIHQSAKAATCTRIGWEEYDWCTRCDYTTYQEIKALGHNYESVVTEPTCTSQGYTTYSCTRCGYIKTDDYVNSLGHNPGDKTIKNIVNPTCTNDGSYDEIIYCIRCNTVLESNNVKESALGHDLVHHDAKAATCTENGWDAYDTCTRCDYTTYKNISSLGHNYNSTTTNPTCTEKGYTTHTCTRCNNTYNDNYISALGHDLVHHDAKEVTCTENGWGAYDTCTRCNYSTYQIIEALGHNYIHAECVNCQSRLPATEGLEFELNSDEKSYAVVGIGTATGEHIIIPSEYNDKPVTKIGKNAFHDNPNIYYVSIPESIDIIERAAFYQCYNLISINLPKKLQIIEDDSFYGCYKLVEVYNKANFVLSSNTTNYGYVGCYAIDFYKEPYISKITIDENGFIIYTKNKMASLIGYIGNQQTITIPDYVTEINRGAFYSNTTVKQVTISNGVTKIGQYAFCNCSIEIIWGDNPSVKEFSSYAFVNYEYESLIIPNSVTTLGYRVFEFCPSTIVWGDNPTITTLGDYSFETYYGTELTIPDSVTTIKQYAFKDCFRLKEIILPNSISSIGFNPFDGDKLAIVTGPISIFKYIPKDELKKAIITDGTAIGNNEFANATKLEEVTLPSTIVSIGESAFSGCTSIEYFYIPSSVIKIGSYAFCGCTCLIEICIPSSVTLIGESAFSGCTYLKTVELSSNLTTISNSLFYNCTNLKSFTLENDSKIESIGDYAFSMCTSLTSMPFDKMSKLTSIGKSAFYSCSLIKTIQIPASVSSLGDSAFASCSSLEELVFEIGSQLTSIKYDTFNGCGFKNIILPSNITSIGREAFINCSELLSFEMPSSISAIGQSILYGCNKLESLNVTLLGKTIDSDQSIKYLFGTGASIPDTLKTIILGDKFTIIDSKLFEYCENLEKIVIPSSTTSIENGAFKGLMRLKNIVFSEDSMLNTIGKNAFYDCKSLSNIMIPNGVTSIGENAFYRTSLDVYYNGNIASWCNISFANKYSNPVGNTNSLYVKENGEYVLVKDVLIPSNLIKIGDYAFYDYANMTSLTFEENSQLTSIGAYAFYNCEIKQLELPSSIININDYAFQSASSIEKIIIPEGCKLQSIGDHSFDYCWNLESINLINATELLTIGGGAFRDCHNLSKVALSDSVQTIESYAFYDCDSLTIFKAGKNLETIEEYAFWHCDNLKKVTINKNIQSIGKCAFLYCPSLAESYFEGNISEWCNINFGDKSANPVYSSENLYIINKYFYEELTELVISNDIAIIKNWAFCNCGSITKIIYQGTIEEWKLVEKGEECIKYTCASVVQCTNGEISIY